MEVDRPCKILFLLVLGLNIGRNFVHADLSDFGGDVRQYMSLLQGTSAFSFSPVSYTHLTLPTKA